jgi:chromosome segregation ATPase
MVSVKPMIRAMSKSGHPAAEEPQRDSSIERLERAVAEERENAVRLRQAADELRFQLDINERSYSKQLEDARQTVAAAEGELAAQQARNAELDAARQDAIELLSEAKTEIDRLAAERDQLRRQLMSRDGWQVEGAAREPEDFGDEGTINALMNDASWARKSEAAADASGRAAAAEAAADEAEEELISPDVVLTARRSDD